MHSEITASAESSMARYVMPTDGSDLQGGEILFCVHNVERARN